MQKTVNTTISENIKKFRKEQGLTQLGLAVRINTTQGYIYQLESGKRAAGKNTLLKLADALHKPIEDFFREEPKYKGIEPTELRRKKLVPLISWVRAGLMHYPITQIDYEGEPIPCSTLDPDAFALRIQGDSMAPKFEDKDIIVVSPGAAVRSGDFAIVKYNGEVTFKKVMIYKDAIILRPLNESYPEVVFRGNKLKRVQMVGKVVESIRRL